MEKRAFLRHLLGAQSLLRAYLVASTQRPHDAEDLLQEVLVILMEKQESYDASRPFRAWALGIARLEVLKWRERQARNRAVLSDAAIEALTRMAEERGDRLDGERRHLDDCMQGLSRSVRGLLEMKYGESLSMDQIASRASSSVAAIEKALVRARASLRSCMERKWRRAGEATA